VSPAAYYFVGSTGPIGRFMPLIIGTARLAREAHGEFVVIGTTGLVHESGRILKNYKALIIQRTLLFAGEPVEVEGATHAERSAEGILIVGAPVAPPPDSKLLPLGFERNLLCGLADATGQCLGLGIIDRIDFAGSTIALTTPVERDKVRIVQFGDLYVTPEGGELRQIKWAW